MRTIETNMNDDYLTDYYPVKRWLNHFRNVFYSVAEAIRGLTFVSTRFLSSLPLHLFPYINSVYTVAECLRQIMITPFQPNKTALQKAVITTRAITTIALIGIYTFVFHSPYAGTVALATTELGFNGTVSGLSKAFNYYKGTPKIDLTEDEKWLRNLNRARTKENIYRTAIAAVNFTGAALLFVPGLQVLGAGIIIAAGLFSLADTLVGFPFPWREKRIEAKNKIVANEVTSSTYKMLLSDPSAQLAPKKKVTLTQHKAPSAKPKKPKSRPTFFREPQKIISAANAIKLCKDSVQSLSIC